MEDVESAEKEASEVLHSLLSVPRIENTSKFIPLQESSTEERVITWDLNGGHLYCVRHENSEFTDGGGADCETDTQFVALDDCPASTTDVEVSISDVTASKKFVKKKPIKLREERKIEDTAQEVRERFNKGCDCQGESCFASLNPESVYRHRLNIAELTKEEHDMYLMGLSMACLGDPSSTIKHKARQRLRSSYLHHGRKVCLSAFLYLENCTLYQLKRIRKHLVTHGVVPRVHGNHGKKPHNVFPLNIYQRATVFLKDFITQYSTNSNAKAPVVLPSDMSRKHVHKLYQKFVRESAPDTEKVMGYSTFRHFMKEQFPHLKFSRTDIGISLSGFSAKQLKSRLRGPLTVEELTSIPVLLKEDGQTYIVTPVESLVTSD
uniref:Galactose-1-phosphate uridylyltransferase n=1 Tax=Lygus hesperus TaxID=30085 RepID=A0A0A9Y6J2_LYGHE